MPEPSRDLVESLAGRTAFIVGSAKNSGKTTLLNFALRRLRPLGGVGFLSIGVDGEERDLVFGCPKPRIRAEAGDLLVTSDRMLQASELGWEVLEVFPGSTVLGRLVLARARRGDTVELCGPENNERLGPVLTSLRDHGARTILVDGAVDRLTQVASLPGAGFVHVVRADPARLSSAQEAMRLLHALSAVPAAEGLPQAGTTVLAGALTRGRLAALPTSVRALVLEDFTKVFLTWREWKAAAQRLDIRFQRRWELLFFCVVLSDVARERFVSGLEPGLLARVLFNPYEVVCA
jgi:hypothetical protein